MKRAILYTFSGTGNTLIAAQMIAKQLIARGVETVIHEVRRPLDIYPSPEKYDLVGFGYPVHAFNAPQIFCNFVRTLPDMRGKQGFFFKTSGEPFCLNDSSSYALHRYLKRKGVDILFERHLLMPYNVMFRYKDALAKQMYLYTEAMSEGIAIRLTSGERDAIKYRVGPTIIFALLKLQWFGAWVNGPLHVVKKDKCIDCGLCERSCPACNIHRVDGKYRFGWRCTMCMRCTMNCPVDAIRPGILTLWRVNGRYPFGKLIADGTLTSDFVNADTKGYFRLFRKYYDRADAELIRLGLTPPRLAGHGEGETEKSS